MNTQEKTKGFASDVFFNINAGLGLFRPRTLSGFSAFLYEKYDITGDQNPIWIRMPIAEREKLLAEFTSNYSETST